MMRKRLICAAAFAVVLGAEILIALFVHDSFVRPYIGDVLAVICVYFFARTFLSEKPRFLSVYVTLFAFCVELVQLTNLSEVLPRVLAVIVGGTFDLTDLLCYLIGGAACFVVDKKIYE